MYSVPLKEEKSATKNEIRYDLNAGIQRVIVVNALGQVVAQAKDLATINMNGLSSGIYIIAVEYINESKQYKTIQL